MRSLCPKRVGFPLSGFFSAKQQFTITKFPLRWLLCLVSWHLKRSKSEPLTEEREERREIDCPQFPRILQLQQFLPSKGMAVLKSGLSLFRLHSCSCPQLWPTNKVLYLLQTKTDDSPDQASQFIENRFCPTSKHGSLSFLRSMDFTGNGPVHLTGQVVANF